MADSDVEIIVGAKDQATKILERVEASTRSFARGVDRMADRTEKSSNRIEVAFRNIAVGAGALLTVDALMRGIQAAASAAMDAVKAYGEYELATQGLTDAQKALARQLQDTLAVDDQVIAGLMRQAGFYDIATESVDDMTMAALGLARVTGEDVGESLKKVNQAINGNVDAFAEAFPQIAQMTSEEEKLAYILERAELGLRDQADAAMMTVGSSQRAVLAIQDMKVTVGQAIAPVQELAGAIVGSLAMGLRDQLAPAAMASSLALREQGDAMLQLKRDTVAFTAGVESMFLNLGDSASLLAMKIKLSFVTFAEDAKHTLTVAVPTYAEWFSENFSTIMEDAADAASTAFGNMTTNIGQSLQVILDLLTGDFTGGIGDAMSQIAEIMQRDLLEGFDPTKIEWPEIPEREPTELEMTIKDDMTEKAFSMIDKLNKTIADRVAVLTPEIKPPEIPEIDLSFNTGALDDVASGFGDLLASIWKGIKLPEKDEVDKAAPELKAMEGRLLTRGSGDQHSEKMLALGGKQNTLLAGIQDVLGQILSQGKDKPNLPEVLFEWVS